MLFDDIFFEGQTVEIVKPKRKRRRDYWVGRVGVINQITSCRTTIRVDFPIIETDDGYDLGKTVVTEGFDPHWVKLVK